jgi:hypothetical protein
MIDFSIITPRLATGGGIIEVEDVVQLKAAGITHVLDVQDTTDTASALLSSGIGYCFNPTADDGQTKAPKWFQSSLDFALPLFAIPRVRILAHCSAGINRGPSTAYTIMRALGWTKMAARFKINVKRPRTTVGLYYAKDGDDALIALGYTF